MSPSWINTNIYIKTIPISLSYDTFIKDYKCANNLRHLEHSHNHIWRSNEYLTLGNKFVIQCILYHNNNNNKRFNMLIGSIKGARMNNFMILFMNISIQ